MCNGQAYWPQRIVKMPRYHARCAKRSHGCATARDIIKKIVHPCHHVNIHDVRHIPKPANAFIVPWVKDRGYDWEFHIDETPFDLWSVQGFYPPREGTEDEKRWIAENKPSPRTHD